MNREEKIKNLIEILHEYEIVIVNSKNLKGFIIEVDRDILMDCLHEQSEHEDIGKDISTDDIDKFINFLDNQNLILLDNDIINSICLNINEYSPQELFKSSLWENN